MTLTTDSVTTQPLGLPEELILMLLNEENGYFHQVPGWNLNCAIIGAVLAELSLQSRIDTDVNSLFLLDAKETGDPVLDSVLKEIASDPVQRNAQYWIERLAHLADEAVDQTLDRLVHMGILEYHEGEFWTLSRTVWQTELYTGSQEGTAVEFVKTRIGKVILAGEIPDPRDAIIIALINTCDVFRFIFPLDEEAEARIDLISKLDVIGRSIAEAVSHNLAGPLLRRAAFSKAIPTVSLRKLLFSPHIRTGNIPALFAGFAEEYGPVFQIRPPFRKPMYFLAGVEVNRWVHRHGRMYLRAREYFSDMEKAYGAAGLIPSLDGADHFRLRKAMHPGYARGRLEENLDRLYQHARQHMTGWTVGASYTAVTMCRRLANAQVSQLTLSIDSQDISDDLIEFKERALVSLVAKIMPKFMMNTPGMKRRSKTVAEVLRRVQSTHTSAQRAYAPRDFADEMLSLHASDPQFLPESNLSFMLSAPLLASMYVGDMLGFALYMMASQPDLYSRIRGEADALFDNGDPDSEDFSLSAIDVTHRFLMECLRMYPTITMSIRNVMNTFVIQGYEMPIGARVHIATTAPHYMKDVFPDPHRFDIDRYLPPRNEHISPGYSPFGLGTHTCLGSRWVELQLAINVLMIAHYFTIEVSPANYKLRLSPFPSMSVSKKLKFRIAERRRELNV